MLRVLILEKAFAKLVGSYRFDGVLPPRPCPVHSSRQNLTNPNHDGHCYRYIHNHCNAVTGYSSSALEGGMSLWALEAMTGDYVSHFCVTKDDSTRWEKRKLVHQETDDDKRKAGLQKVSKHDEYDPSEVRNVHARANIVEFNWFKLTASIRAPLNY